MLVKARATQKYTHNIQLYNICIVHETNKNLYFYLDFNQFKNVSLCPPSRTSYYPSLLSPEQPPHLLFIPSFFPSFLIQVPLKIVNLIHVQKASALPCICSS